MARAPENHSDGSPCVLSSLCCGKIRLFQARLSGCRDLSESSELGPCSGGAERGALRAAEFGGVAWRESDSPAAVADVLRVHDWPYLRRLQVPPPAGRPAACLGACRISFRQRVDSRVDTRCSWDDWGV